MKVVTSILEEDIFMDGRLVVEWWLGRRPNKWLLPSDYKVVGQQGAVIDVEVEVPDNVGPEEDPLWATWELLQHKYGDRA